MLTDLLKVLPQFALPQRALSRAMHRFMQIRLSAVKNLQIKAAVSLYDIDLQSARQQKTSEFLDFNSFFTRELKENARPLGPGDHVLCPADGTISSIGYADGDHVYQAKGREYSTSELLADPAPAKSGLADAAFVTVYLSPRDYHRVHMPLGGRLREMRHIPGRLFSVNASTVRLVPRLFARNERVACLFDTQIGPVAIVLVGAIFVGSIETVWAGKVTPPYGNRPQSYLYDKEQDAVVLKQGAEMGRFNMGSTVIVLCPRNAVKWSPELREGKRVLMGQSLGESEE